MDKLLKDFRYGFRTLAKSPRFTIIAIICLAFGIGVNTAMFSFVDAVLLKPLGYRDAERLVSISETGPRCDRCLPSPPTFIEWKTLNTVFSQVSAYTSYTTSLNLTGREEAEQIQSRSVSADYFDLLGIRPAIGRAFQEGEDRIGNEQVVILSNRFWRRRFGSDTNIIGSAITLDEKLHTVIGILPPGGVFDRMDNDVWLPLAIRPDQMRRSTQFFSALARLKPGVTVQQADAEMKRLAQDLERRAESPREGYGVIVEPLRDSIVKTDIRSIMLLLMGAVLFILLIASVNVANLLLARGANRSKEIAIRLAVGATRWRLMRQLLTESLMLAVAGGCAGTLLAYWLIEAFTAFVPPSTIPEEAVIGLDYRVLAFTLGISLVTGVLFGIIPAWQATKLNLTSSLKDHTLSSSTRFSRNKSRSLLLVSEIALTFMLVIGATLMIKSFGRLLDIDPGFQTESILSFKTTLAQGRFPQSHQAQAYQGELLGRIRALPGVRSASVTNALPLTGSGTGTDFLISGRSQGDLNKGNARIRAIDPDYFETLGIRLAKGRFLTESDTLGAQPVIMVNASLADKFWPDEDPIGQQVRFMGPESFSVAGVIADVKHNGLASESPFEIYVSLAQVPETWSGIARSLSFVVRANADPSNLAGTIQTLAAEVDKDQPLFAIRTLDEVVSESVAKPRFRTYLFGVFAGLALILAATGIYGVMAYSVTQRTYEIGIRMAMGARPQDIFKMVIGQGLGFALAGVALGLVAAYYLSRVLESLLYQVSATDPATFALVSLLLIAVALLACYIPARRATKVDPMVALRYE